jgi:hypothetical protein
MLEVYDFNQAAMRPYERARFRVIVRRRDRCPGARRAPGLILMDATIADFDSPVLARLHPAE